MRKYIVAYSYQDKFELDETEAQALIMAKEKGMAGIKVADKYLTTSFLWLVPKEETKAHDFTSKELQLCEDVAEWLSRDESELNWSFESALDYSKKLMGRVGIDEVRELWDVYANGAYPSVRKFLMEAKQVSDLDEPVDTSHLLDTENPSKGKQ